MITFSEEQVAIVICIIIVVVTICIAIALLINKDKKINLIKQQNRLLKKQVKQLQDNFKIYRGNQLLIQQQNELLKQKEQDQLPLQIKNQDIRNVEP